METESTLVNSAAENCVIGVAIVTFNGAQWIRRCLESLRAGKHPVSVVVVDNCSTDNTAELIKQNHPEVELLLSSKNSGFGVGNNIAIARLLERGCPLVFLLNQDAYVLPDTMSFLLAYMGAHPAVGVVSPLHCSPDERHVDPKMFRGYLGPRAPEYMNDLVMGNPLTQYRVEGVNAAAWLVRADVFFRVGGFDPLFFMYGEDDDLLARMKQHDVHFSLVPQAKIVHLRESPPSATSGSWFEKVRRRARLTRSTLLVQIKRPGYSQLFRVRLLVADGLLRPLASWIVKPDAVELAAALYASAQLLFALHQVKAHVDQLSVAGPHFLPLSPARAA